MVLPEGFSWYQGSHQDRLRLRLWLKLSYQDVFPQLSHWDHLATTVDQLYHPTETPCWWICSSVTQAWVGCVWMGRARDQITHSQVGYLFLVRVDPAYRRQGLGRALLQKAETWARTLDLTGLQLQVFVQNEAAVQFYQATGFSVQGYWLAKDLG